MGAFPKLAGQTSDYISQKLYAYKNREQVGAMSSTMWAQASMLSDQDIQTLSDFIQKGVRMIEIYSKHNVLLCEGKKIFVREKDTNIHIKC